MEKITEYICREGFAEVDTKWGRIRGLRQNGVYAFLGVDYGKAKRFRPAEDPECWEGVKPALDYGTVCPTVYPASMRGDHVLPHRFYVQDENCLNLNVWTTTLDPSAKRAVMVWFHGGGYSGGSANDFTSYEGWNLAKYGEVVSVTVNHRLNVLGCLDLSAYGEEYQPSGNLIMQDGVKALQWVHDNIEKFGGDPGNVTIYGQSGGGGKITTLMQMPSADGLYHRAIVHSGIIRFADPAATGAMRITKEDALKCAKNLVEGVGSVKKLETMPVDDLMKAVREYCDNPGFIWTPVPGAGDYAGDIGQTGGFREETRHIPTMIGNSLTEFPRVHSGKDKASMSEEEKLEAIREIYGEDAEAVKACFEKCYPELNSYYASGMDMSNFRPMGKLFCEWRDAMGAAPAYNYLLTYEMPYDGGTMSTHGTELPFIFHNADAVWSVQKNTERTWSFQDELFFAWVSFAKTGNPNHDKLPVEWKPYTKDHHSCMLFGDTPSCRNGHDEELIALVSEANKRSGGRIGRLPA